VASFAPDHRPHDDVSWAEAVRAYGEGVRVLQRLGSKYVEWDLPTACAGWRAIDVAGHALCTARRYHRLLDAALAGRPEANLPWGRALVEVNALELATLGVSAGADRIVAFDAVATRYGERLADADPALLYGTWAGVGPLTVGQHTLLAACEWHLHAWDLADALGWDYRPADAGPLLAGMRLAPHADGGGAPVWDPWRAVLATSGRREPAEPRPLGP
jgi:hypothetical protein